MPFEADVTVKNWNGVSASLSRRIARKVIAAKMAAYAEAEAIMADSKENFVPVDDGILRASGHVKPPQVTAEGIHIVLAYGGAAQAYAVIQHENLDFQHTVGEAKYLETPFLNRINSGLTRRVFNAMKGSG